MTDRLDRLRTLRDQLTGWLEEPAADRAQLALRLSDVLAQIDALEKAQPAKEATALDELRAKRAARQTKSPARPSRTKS